MNSLAVKTLKHSEDQASLDLNARPVLILTINNGAAHTQAAEAIATAWQEISREIPVQTIEISEFMSPLARLTHVSLYLWLVKNTPKVWEKIDAFQKRRTQTSPEWFYRRECRRLFECVEKLKPSAIVATEVGCGEIAALIKRDLNLHIPLAAVSLDADADRAWIQPEIDFYSVTSNQVKKDFENLGAEAEKVNALGVPLKAEFFEPFDTEKRRRRFFTKLNLNEALPLVLISGGGEGLGKIRQMAENLLDAPTSKNIVVLAGKNTQLKKDCERLVGKYKNLRVFGWTENLASIYHAADVLIGKLGLTFYEAAACGLPLVALEPPPGAERVQFKNLDATNFGRAATSINEAVSIVEDLLRDTGKLVRMKTAARNFQQINASEILVNWLGERLKKTR